MTGRRRRDLAREAPRRRAGVVERERRDRVAKAGVASGVGDARAAVGLAGVRRRTCERSKEQSGRSREKGEAETDAGAVAAQEGYVVVLDRFPFLSADWVG